MLYQINKGSKSFGANTIFENIQFEIKNIEKIAIVGRNGCGKSTLMKCISQEILLDQGTIHQQNGIKIGYLSQQIFADDKLSVEVELNKVFADLKQIKIQLDELTEQMLTDHSDKLLTKYADLHDEFENRNGYGYQAEIMTLVTKFGFSKKDLSRPINSFSGGQRTKLAFIKLLLSKPDILLLDEPTNHLDIETIQWLEDYIKRYEKAVVIVSHDRMFIDRVCNVIYDMEYGTLKKYVANYSDFLVQKKNDIERIQEAYERQQKDIKRLEVLIDKFRYKKNKAAFAQSKIKYLERMDKIENVKDADTRSFKAGFTSRIKGGKRVLEVDQLEIGYDFPLTKISLEIMQGQRIAIIGANGTGKSTFIKTLMKEVKPLSGSFLLGHQIEIGYFSQQQAEYINNKTVVDELWDSFPDLNRTEIRTVLGRFLFSADEVFKNVSVLSGGEKVRLTLAKLMLQHGNFLLLDEPTNHLDIPSKEALEDALKDYDGTILFVSHDRYFIKQIATSVLVLDDKKAVFYPDGYQDYIDQENNASKENNDSLPLEKSKSNKLQQIKPINAKREIKKIELKIDEMEQLLSDKRELRFEPEYYHDFNKMNELDEEIDQIHNDLEHLMQKWEELNEIIE